MDSQSLNLPPAMDDDELDDEMYLVEYSWDNW